jgi:uncharacterized repeat protein (TIGR03837 family)
LIQRLGMNQSDLPYQLSSWSDPLDFSTDIDIVVEAFGCDIPEDLWQFLPAQGLWINLEYLALEEWALSCHGRRSSGRIGWPKYFFFPGFRKGLGGILLPELDEIKALRSSWLEEWDVPLPWESALWWSLFRYEQPPESFWSACEASLSPVILWAPEGKVWNGLSETFQRRHWQKKGRFWSFGHVLCMETSFLHQTDFIRLLHLCDWNWVRGEDSLQMCLGMGQPFLWQPYPQAEDAHLDKLQGLTQGLQDLGAPEAWVSVLSHLQPEQSDFEQLMEIDPNAIKKWWNDLSNVRQEWDLVENLITFAQNNLSPQT